MAIREDDYAAMLATVERWMSRDEIAEALSVDERTLDEIASVYVCDEDVARRLRALATSGRGGRVPSAGLKGLVVFCRLRSDRLRAVTFILLTR